VGLSVAGCGKGAESYSEAVAEREAARASARQLEAEIEALEVRLYSGQATVRLWNELADRHNNISALACRNVELHKEGMAVLRRQRRHGPDAGLLAQSAVPGKATGAHADGYGSRKSGSGRSKLAP
jgi:hypothetical protein